MSTFSVLITLVQKVSLPSFYKKSKLRFTEVKVFAQLAMVELGLKLVNY